MTQRCLESLKRPQGRPIFKPLAEPSNASGFSFPSKENHERYDSMHQFEAVSQEEMLAVEGGVLGFFGRIAVRVAAKAIIYVIDKVTD
jgi:hypothetical protein